MTPHAVYDTNVIVSAILKPGSLPASLVALAMQGAVKLFLTREILEEYEEVLKRPAFGFDAGVVDTFRRNSTWLLMVEKCRRFPGMRCQRSWGFPGSSTVKSNCA